MISSPIVACQVSHTHESFTNLGPPLCAMAFQALGWFQKTLGIDITGIFHFSHYLLHRKADWCECCAGTYSNLGELTGGFRAHGGRSFVDRYAFVVGEVGYFGTLGGG